MKKTNGFSIILIIPIIVLVLVIGGVFAYKLFSEGTRAKASESTVQKITPPLTGSGKKPTAGYGNVQAPTAKVTPATSPQGSGSDHIDIDTLLNEKDEGGVGDLESLKASETGL